MMLFHYTSRPAADLIRRARAIRPEGSTLYRGLFGHLDRDPDPGPSYRPVVWLSTNPIMEGTVAAKMMVYGCPDPVGALCRFALPGDYPRAVPFDSFRRSHPFDPEWWHMLVYTAGLIGSTPDQWRVVEAPIPAADWAAVEVFAPGGRWAPLPPPPPIL